MHLKPTHQSVKYCADILTVRWDLWKATGIKQKYYIMLSASAEAAQE